MEILCGFRVFEYALMVKKRKPGNAGDQYKASKLKAHPVVRVIITRKLLKCNQFVI